MTTQYAPPANPSTDRITDSSIWKRKDLQHCVHRGLSSMESSQWTRKNSLSCCLLYAETATATKLVGIKSSLLFLTVVGVPDVKELVQSFMLKLLIMKNLVSFLSKPSMRPVLDWSALYHVPWHFQLFTFLDPCTNRKKQASTEPGMKATEDTLIVFANWWNAKEPFLLLLSFILQHHDTWLTLLMLRNLIVLHVATSQQWLQIVRNALMFYISHSPQKCYLYSIVGSISSNEWDVSSCCLSIETKIPGGGYWWCSWDRLPNSLAQNHCLWLFTTLPSEGGNSGAEW